MSNPIIDVTLSVSFDAGLQTYQAHVTATIHNVGNDIQSAVAQIIKGESTNVGTVSLSESGVAGGVATWSGEGFISAVSEGDLVYASLGVIWQRSSEDRSRSAPKSVPKKGYKVPPPPAAAKAKRPSARKNSAKKKTNTKKTAKKNRIATIVTPPKEVKE